MKRRVSDERRRVSIGTRGESGIPCAHRAGVTERSAGELERQSSWIGAGADIVPVEDVLAQGSVPAGLWHGEPRAAEVVWCRVGVGIEGCVAMPRIARPPADRHLLRIHRVAHDEISRWRIGRQAGEEVHGKVERTPPRIDRRRSPDVRRTKLRQDERCLRRCHEVVGSPTLVVPRVFAVFIEWDAPRHLLRRRVDLECATEPANCGQHLPRHDSHRSIRSQGDPLDPAAAVLDGRLVDAQVENDHERP